MTTNHHAIAPSHASLQPAEPLWKRAPTRDDSGRPYSDFMILLPKLRNKPRPEFVDIVCRIESVLHAYHHAVVFADLNPKLNLLWVTIHPIPGMVLELATAINHLVPEARLVAEQPRVRRP